MALLVEWNHIAIGIPRNANVLAIHVNSVQHDMNAIFGLNSITSSSSTREISGIFDTHKNTNVKMSLALKNYGFCFGSLDSA